jgi:H+/Cl- antiporter ClcA
MGRIKATREGEPRLLLESAFLGVAGALSARLFMWMLGISDRLFLFHLAGYRPPGLERGGDLSQHIGPHGLWLVPAVTTLGGLLSGILVYRFAPEAEGHGTDTAVNAFHRQEGIIRPRVAPVKMLASAITIGSGGAAGREGPIALITATLGSWYARLTHHTEDQRRLLLLAGMAAGLSAIFRSPMGTGVFAIEVLYGNMEFEVGALLYTMLASAVAYAVNGFFVGFSPLFRIPAIPTPAFASYAAYAALGGAAGLIATLLPVVFYRVRDLFRLLPVPLWTKPGIGGLALGVLALWLDTTGNQRPTGFADPAGAGVCKDGSVCTHRFFRRFRWRIRAFALCRRHVRRRFRHNAASDTGCVRCGRHGRRLRRSSASAHCDHADGHRDGRRVSPARASRNGGYGRISDSDTAVQLSQIPQPL